jgi:hypothetical protein
MLSGHTCTLPVEVDAGTSYAPNRVALSKFFFAAHPAHAQLGGHSSRGNRGLQLAQHVIRQSDKYSETFIRGKFFVYEQIKRLIL